MNPNPEQHPGITDEAAVEAHDVIHHAEEEEEQLHNKPSNQSQSSEPGLGGAAQGGSASAAPDTGKKSNLEKVKEKLHLNK